MTTFPFSGRLDLPVACLLVSERYGALANRTVTPGDVARMVIDLIHLLDVDAEDLENVDEFDAAVGEAMEELVGAGWLKRRNYRGVIRYASPPLAEDALVWFRQKLGSRPRRLRAFDALQDEVTELVLEQYGEGARQPTNA